MPRARKACTEPDCSELKPCPIHDATHNWDRHPSPRRQRRGRTGWREYARAQRVLNRYHRICHVCGKPGANVVDHVDNNGPDDESNLRPIHQYPCHKEKTQREAQEARAHAIQSVS
jgi:hypothetical protein